jgi:hypothetical protein
MHITEPRRHQVRSYGWYSNLSWGKRRTAEAETGEVGGGRTCPDSCAACAEARDVRAFRRSWAQLIKRIYEVDPLVCPLCGSEMKVIAVISEHDVADTILKLLEGKKKQEARAPPN